MKRHVTYRLPGILILVLSAGLLYAQRYGLPGIHNFSRSEYKGGTQNWAVAQASNGRMYFGNNYGLVEFDGARWTVYKDLELVIRSLCADDTRMYVGAFNNFGYYEDDTHGQFKFHSLVPLLKNRITDFDEIWRIHKTNFGIVFQSFKAIFIYSHGKIDIVCPPSKFHFSYYVNGILWVYDEHEGLMQYRDGNVQAIPDGSRFAGMPVWAILPLNDDQIIVGTAKNGLFRYAGGKFAPWDNPVNEMLKKYQIFSGALTVNKNFAFGTIQNGLIVSDSSGRVLLELNKERGLTNNTVLSIGNDREGNLWLGLDNGITVIHIHSPITFFRNYYNLGSGYASARFGDDLYVGTNQGLFYIRWKDFINPLKKKEDFHLIEGTEGQVWCLTIIDNALLCGHNLGVFQIFKNKAVKVSAVPGGWNIIKIKGEEPRLLVGTYSGLSVLEKRGPLWEFRNHLSGFDQSSHYLEQDSKGYIWVSHGYKGLYRIKPDAGFHRADGIRFYNSKTGLPSDHSNTLFKLQSGIAVGTQEGIFRYNETTDTFEPDVTLNQLFHGAKLIEYLAQDSAHNIWYYHNQQPGVLRFQEDGTYTNITAPFVELSGMVIPAFGHMNTLDPGSMILGLEGGFAHYVSGQFNPFGFLPTLYISKIRSGDTSEGTYRYNSSNAPQGVVPAFRYNNNSITIDFAANQFSGQGTSFQFRLDGFNEAWSEWSPVNSKEYTNLPAGEYAFQLKARTVQGKTTPILSYKFLVLPPWYRTVYAWIAYSLLFVCLLYLGYRLLWNSMEKSRLKEIESQKNLYRLREQKLKEEALVTEKEIVSLRNEKLNLEMVHKEKELANASMMIIQKNEILHKLKIELNKIKNALTDENLKNDLTATIKRIGKEIDNEKQWQVFNTHVEQVHEELFKKLKTHYPDLTPRELSLCAYLRMNISSKEIATLMNISARGVEISRYRIRKKLRLDREANLAEFMINL